MLQADYSNSVEYILEFVKFRKDIGTREASIYWSFVHNFMIIFQNLLKHILS